MATVAAQVIDYILVDMKQREVTSESESDDVNVRGLVGCLIASNYFFRNPIGGNIHKKSCRWRFKKKIKKNRVFNSRSLSGRVCFLHEERRL